MVFKKEKGNESRPIVGILPTELSTQDIIHIIISTVTIFYLCISVSPLVRIEVDPRTLFPGFVSTAEDAAASATVSTPEDSLADQVSTSESATSKGSLGKSELDLLLEQEAIEAMAVPDAVELPVSVIHQRPSLPNGCEITSATILLQYAGYGVSKDTMADTYLPQSSTYYNGDPEVEFMGNPRHTSGPTCGYYCWPGAIVTAVNRYLTSSGTTTLRCRDISGTDVEGLKNYLRRGIPVAVWVTVGYRQPRHSDNFRLPNGERPYNGLHCMVLSGYGDGHMIVQDPLGISSSVDESLFSDIYTAIGSRAVILQSVR